MTADLAYEPGSVLLVAGLPGSGKTTLLRRAVPDPHVLVLDSDDVRRALQARLGGRCPALLRPVVHVVHYLRIALAVVRPGPSIVVHETGTRPRLRRALIRLAALGGRRVHALFLDVDPAQATAAQHARPRRAVSARGMRRHAGQWRALRSRLLAQGGLRDEGYASTRVLNRSEASSVERIVFSTSRSLPISTS